MKTIKVTCNYCDNEFNTKKKQPYLCPKCDTYFYKEVKCCSLGPSIMSYDTPIIMDINYNGKPLKF